MSPYRTILAALVVIAYFKLMPSDAVPVDSQVDKEKVASISQSPTVNAPKSWWDFYLGGFTSSFYVIIISELGDKTFFIAAIMAMQNPRLLVYVGAMTALTTMTILSAILGYATTVIPRSVTFYASGVLFLIFGAKMIHEASQMPANSAQEEFEEVQMQLNQSKLADPESGNITEENLSFWRRTCNAMKQLFTPVFAEAFVLTFLAEWGDRSQITTIILAATKSAAGVITGGVLGHAVCTGVAVLMGRFIAQRIPVRWITLIGGATFLLFALSTFISSPDSNS